jgi:glucose/arabinose dehydrogenase
VIDIIDTCTPLISVRLHLVTYPILLLVVGLLSLFMLITTSDHTAAAYPTLEDPNLKVEIVAEGITFPTSMAFLANEDILVLEKNNGTVKRVIHGQVQPEPLLDLNVANQGERGMLGIAVARNNNGTTYAFLYFTESSTGNDYSGDDGNYEPLGNRLYRYEWLNGSLTNPKLLLDLPAVPGPNHNGGNIAVGPDNNLYLSIGNLNDKELQDFRTQAENLKVGKVPDGRSGILRVTQDGKAVLKDNLTLLGNKDPLDKYYAYGIRNSFGMAFDPVTGNLWDTENGPDYGDEINLVEPGFNSGWLKVQGIWKTRPNGGQAGDVNFLIPEDLVNFDGKGNYSVPEFIWFNTVGPTEMEFLNSDKYGEQYENDMFVGDFNNGTLYNFDLDKNRTGLYLREPLIDRIAHNPGELQNIVFGRGFGGITDVELGPDGYLYILAATLDKIFRIVPY